MTNKANTLGKSTATPCKHYVNNQIVIPVVVGSNPIGHPTEFKHSKLATAFFLSVLLRIFLRNVLRRLINRHEFDVP